jgi:hypothetical protein
MSSEGEIITDKGKVLLEDADFFIGKRITCKDKWCKGDGMLKYPD